MSTDATAVVASTFEVTVDGHPVAWQRAGRSKSGHTFTPRRVREHQAILREMVGYLWARQPLDVPLRLTLYFRMHGQRTADIDNLAKTVLDALNGVLYVDDRQVQQLFATRTLGHAANEAGTRILATWEEPS